MGVENVGDKFNTEDKNECKVEDASHNSKDKEIDDNNTYDIEKYTHYLEDQIYECEGIINNLEGENIILTDKLSECRENLSTKDKTLDQAILASKLQEIERKE